MDGWIGLSGCGCGKWKVDVESGRWRGSGSHINYNKKNLVLENMHRMHVG